MFARPLECQSASLAKENSCFPQFGSDSDLVVVSCARNAVNASLPKMPGKTGSFRDISIAFMLALLLACNVKLGEWSDSQSMFLAKGAEAVFVAKTPQVSQLIGE
jgi:hypothetical protein